jgi:hypothetical protein
MIVMILVIIYRHYRTKHSLRFKKCLKETKNLNNIFLPERQWQRNETKLTEEYCRTITQAAARSCCGLSGASVLEFGFQLDSF